MKTEIKKAFTSMLFILVFAACSTTAFAAIQKTPYLIYPGVNTEMEVLWQDTATETTNTLSWGTDTTYSMGSETVLEYGSFNQHKHTITGLTPNTKYFYKVADDTNGVYGTGSFITAPVADATSIRFLAIGDTRSYPYQMDAVMQAMKDFYSIPGNEDYQRLTIHNGDWVSTDGESYWTSQWFTGYADIVAFTASTPIDGCKGNHDNASGYSATFPKYFPFPYTNLTAKTTNPTVDSSGNPYYNNLYWSFDYGPVHFTIVDQYSTYAPGSPQYIWLTNDLAAANANVNTPWKILIYHAPAYSAGADADDAGVRALEPLVTQYNVDVIYCGHSHNYARTGAYNSAQAGGDKIALNVPHITSGGGGAPVYAVDQSNGTTFKAPNGVTYGPTNYPHVITAWPATEFMTFDVAGKTLTMTAYQVNGASTSGLVNGLTLSPIETTVINHFNNVSSQVTATTGNVVYNRATKTYNGNLTLKNNGPALTGKIHVVLDGILNLGTATVPGVGHPDNEYFTESSQLAAHLPLPTSIIAINPATGPSSTPGSGLISNVTLLNQTGSNNGEPMILATPDGIASGASVTVPLQFSNPANVKINFNSVTLNETP